MKKLSLLLLASVVVTLPFVARAQQNKVSHIGNFDLNWQNGEAEVARTPRGKLTFTLNGLRGPVSFILQEKGSAALKKARLSVMRREFSGRVLTARAQEIKGKDKEGKGGVQVLDVTMRREVALLIEQVGLEGEKTTIKVRCDEANYKAGTKPGAGRIDFSGNARVWYYGLLDTETTVESGWIDLGDPDDLENKPPTLHLGAGSTTGTIKESEGKKK